VFIGFLLASVFQRPPPKQLANMENGNKITSGSSRGGGEEEEAKVPLLEPRAADDHHGGGGGGSRSLSKVEQEEEEQQDDEWSSLGRRAWEENKKLWVVAGPSIFTRFSSFGLTVISQAFVGHIGATELAAYALVSTVLMRFSNGILVWYLLFSTN